MSDERTFAHVFRTITVEVLALAEQTPTWAEFRNEMLNRLRVWSAELDALSPPEGWAPVYDQVRLLVAKMLAAKSITPAGKGLARMIDRNLQRQQEGIANP